MNSITPIARYFVTVGAAVACAAVMAMRPLQQQDLADLSNEQLKLAYLDCARVSSESLLEPDLFTICSVAADALLQREFGGDLERQLQWWRVARGDPGRSHAASARNLHALLVR